MNNNSKFNWLYKYNAIERIGILEARIKTLQMLLNKDIGIGMKNYLQDDLEQTKSLIDKYVNYCVNVGHITSFTVV